MINPRLPLIDLHRHLDGNIRAKTIWELAHKHEIVLPVEQFDDFIPYVQIIDSESNLLAFLQKLDWGVAVLKTLDDCKRIAYENVEDAFNAGINYAELRFSPYYMAKSHQLNTADVVAAVIDGVRLGMKDFDVKINLIGILSRTFGVEKCQHELNAILAHKQAITAVDLAGDEYNFPGELFVEHFKQVTKADLQVTVHAGEAAGSESIWQAIQGLNANRIGHGVACQHDNKLMDYMRDNDIAIESCITSNYQTGTVTDIDNHPIKTFLANELLVCLNTDDPAVQNIELKHEFNLASSKLQLNDSQISQLQQNALNASFLSENEKQTLLKQKQN
ncbi:adenosine deaminase [Thalassotalea castellviae]|uniref:adenosine deaminase n=1 Tax=Thalassotalea castellviae TaxID=3075612 RepID=A0ABU2ZW58_9GAMM|nr:adenosine deaminase [Thalassotalea sp. W431]MDT0602170.1 adenosine deaminase [Thalassotalea sp. W431]